MITWNQIRTILIVAAMAIATLGAGPQPRRTPMVRIPAGAFLPLYDEGLGAVRVASFALDEHAVTRAQFAAYRGRTVASDQRDLPVTNVTRAEAAAYCSAAGGRLPTQNEWEYVAAASPTAREARSDPAYRQRVLDLYARQQRGRPAAVRSTFRNAYGVHDMHGLVWEWVAAEHHDHAAGRHDMTCAGSASGATDTRNYGAFLRFAFRSGLTPETKLPGLGFRCAR